MDPRGARGTAAGAGGGTAILAPVTTPTHFSTPARNFLGLQGGFPPDPIGDVGPDHYLQAVNSIFDVLNKDDGTSALTPAGPRNLDALWVAANAGGNCQGQNRGDPVVLFDQLADRFVLAQFARPNHVCIAVSQTANPVTGGWNLYEFAVPGFPDYFKLGVWPDAYYMGSNQGNVGVSAFDRTNMLTGAVARAPINFSQAGHLGSNFMLPSDADGETAPPAGAPNYFYRHVDGANFGGADRLEIFEFHVDFGTPGNSTFTGPTNVPLAGFDSDMCGRTEFTTCVPQPGITQTLDPIIEWPMWRLQYRNFGTRETMVGNFTVDIGDADQAGIRWFELRKVGSGAWTLFQEGDHSPDAAHRWMGSVAMDRDGNMALGYSVSSPGLNVFPSLRYVGRFADDPAGTLPRGEFNLIAGSGSQTGCQTVGSICIGRWGDYSSMNVDPVDDCTFWYTGEYFTTRSQTRIGSFRLCNDPPTADAGGPYVTNEGTNVGLDGTGSTDPNPTDTLSFAWDLDDDGAFDDSTSQTPTFSAVGQDGVFDVCLEVTDEAGASDSDCTTVTVNNVAPAVVGLAANDPRPENTAVTVTGMVTDPGWLDPLTATVDWGDGTPVEPIAGTLENVRPDATLTFSTSHVYGDNGTFTVDVCGSDDDTTTCASIPVVFTNIDPTAQIDTTGAVLVGGVPTFIAHAGDPVTFSARSTDPGSDDLTLSWNFGDGTPIVTVTSLVNPPATDPADSPSIQPRDVTDSQTHAFAGACTYVLTFGAEDDDGGNVQDTVDVVITGNAEAAGSAGFWHRQARGDGQFDPASLQCLLDIAGFMSSVFNEERDASTPANARDVLKVNQTSDMAERLDRQLLAAWLNFANGALDLSEMVDTVGGSAPDTTFGAAIAAAEAVRLDPASTRAELEEQKDILERINTSG
ncbi:MAG TPA: PKD domain-containing protein [Actinomycetota bacterium]|nr:PKD domain-containing protein [Actinomycetota bacterium]